MNFLEARNYINEVGKKGSILGLENMNNLMNKLGNVQDKVKVLHIAGTNGKGSTSAYISEILKEAGFKVGKYTSPAVFNYLEIFKINDEMIKEEDYAELVSEIKEKIEELVLEGLNEPTAFEVETALAYLWFYREKCDFAVIETGLGGITDATNVVSKPILSVLTPISMDHMQFLGNTIEEIAEKKAGIIKRGCDVVTSVQEQRVLEVIKENAKRKESNLVCTKAAKGKFDIKKTEVFYEGSDGVKYETETLLLGSFQLQNIATAIECAIALKGKKEMWSERISKCVIEDGIKKTMWHGRFEKIGEKPDIYFDGGHNPGAALNIKDTIEIYFTNKKIVYIIGVLADKDYDSVLKITAPYAEKIITITPPENARALDGRKLLETVKKYNDEAMYIDNLDEAIELGKELAGEDGVLIIFGSLSYLGRIKI